MARRVLPWLALCVGLLACACATAPRMGPQHASFPPEQRTAQNGPLTLELVDAYYDLRQVMLVVRLTHHGDTPITIEHRGLLLAYGDLEFPLDPNATPLGPTARTILAAEVPTRLELRFRLEEPLTAAATLHLLSLKQADHWLDPLRLTVPPPAAYVDRSIPVDH